MNMTSFQSESWVYYPGSGADFGSIRRCLMSIKAKSFLFVDCGISRSEICNHLQHHEPCTFGREERLAMALEQNWDDQDFLDYSTNILDKETGYTLECLEDIPLDSLFALNPCLHVPGEDHHLIGVGAVVEPYALLARFRKREGDPRVAHWPETLHFLCLGTEAISTYDLLFCQEGQQAPKAVILQAGMHIGWGNGSPLHVLAQETARLPDFQLLIDPKPDPWEGYELLDGDLWRRIG